MYTAIPECVPLSRVQKNSSCKKELFCINLKYFFYFFSSTFFLNLLVKSKEIGVAMNSDEYVPTMIPTNKAKMNPLIDAPPKMNIANNTTMVDNEVLNVRRSVEFNASFTTCSSSRFGYNLRYSRIRSNTTTVSLMV